MLSIVPVHRMYLVANFKETQLDRMRPGQPVEISVDALDGHTVHGRVESFAPGTGAQFALIPPSNAIGNFTKIVQRVPVRIRLDDGALNSPILVAGLSMTASVDVSAVHIETHASHTDLDQLAVLAGMEPGQLDAMLSPHGMLPLPPANVPVGNPAGLLRRQPDIRQAERQLAASNARIGQVIAQYFPSVTLFGTIGFPATDTSHLFTDRGFTYIGGPALSWSIHNFPRIAAQVRGAKADRDAAVAQYQNIVLTALQDAETSLSRYGYQRENDLRLAAAQKSASHAARLTRMRQEGGTASLIDALDTERQRMQTEQSLAEAQTQSMVDYAALQKALGLGWQAPDGPGDVQALGRKGPDGPGSFEAAVR